MTIINRRRKKSIRFLGIYALAFVVVVFPFSVSQSRAESFDIFVDKNYSGSEEDGSSEKPYTSIEKAVLNAGSEALIFVKNGTYEEEVILTGKQKLEGQDKNKTIIKNSGSLETISLKGENKIKNITVLGGHTAVAFYGKGLLENCVIKNASRKGIDLTQSSGSVEILNSKIIGNRKGIYIQKGRDIKILNNQFVSNLEEGIDIREKVSGTISGNIIASNKEGGIEVVVGSANLTIRSNRIERNSASGIAVQFYESASKTGQVKITQNTISRNGGYGIRCSSPGGEEIPESYWNDSLDVTDNKIEKNSGKAIAGACNLIKAITPEEEKSNIKIESETAKDPAIQSKIEKEREEEIRREEEAARQKREQLRQQIENARQLAIEREKAVAQKAEKIRNQKKFRLFLVGNNPSLIAAFRQELENLRNALDTLRKIKKDEENNEEIKLELLSSFIDELDSRLKENENFINNQEKKFSLFGWLIRMFRK